jgi:hypothetical protein
VGKSLFVFVLKAVSPVACQGHTLKVPATNTSTGDMSNRISERSLRAMKKPVDPAVCGAQDALNVAGDF